LFLGEKEEAGEWASHSDSLGGGWKPSKREKRGEKVGLNEKEEGSAEMLISASEKKEGGKGFTNYREGRKRKKKIPAPFLPQLF